MTRPDPTQTDPFAQVMVDRHGLVRYWSPEAERLFGHPAAAVLGQPVDFVVVPAYHAAHWHGFRMAMEQESVERKQGAGNIPVLYADGSVRLHPFRQTLLCDAFGRTSGAVVVFSAALAPGEKNSLPTVFADGQE